MNTPKDYPWGSYDLNAGESVFWRLGPLNLWCKKVEDELWIGFLYDQEGEENNDPNDNPAPPDNLNWERWLLKKGSGKLELKPAFPDLPVVVKPEYAFRVGPNAAAKVFVRVPLWVQLNHGNFKVTEIPTVKLSKTWFGNFRKGELCYWISSSARRSVTEDLIRIYRAVCPIDIRNKSDDEMLIDKICLRVSRLAIFKAADQYWGSETKAHFRGHDDMSDLEVSKKPPADAPKAVLVATAREEHHMSFTAKTFMSLKELSGIDFFSW
ncbi:MAG: DUF432 domain-containing protein [Calditrichae bacterium]|nr:DUF432 domain-containing protein [Calditrichota bacterium]MCB9058419.1 DUF432 domain-containing protein [Calditrichia bacterium]